VGTPSSKTISTCFASASALWTAEARPPVKLLVAYRIAARLIPSFGPSALRNCQR